MSGRCLAMWSGPRNLSTAMMRAFGNRADTIVVDEPFYAHFLHRTGLDHPMRDDIVAAGEIDWRKIVNELVTRPDDGLFYQKHITTHWHEAFGIDWLGELSHAFLIRAPEPVVASYDVKRKGSTPLDLGYPQQAALFDAITTLTGEAPPVIDSARFLQDPQSQLRLLCERLHIAFDPAMLAWPAGMRDSDGIWGEHWYDSVNRSTGFASPDHSTISAADLDARGRHVAAACRPYYETLLASALSTSDA